MPNLSDLNKGHRNIIHDELNEFEFVTSGDLVDEIDFNLEDNIIDRVKNIEGDLNKTENTKYTTTNGSKEFSCKDGYIDNIYIEGETLVNLLSRGYEFDKHGDEQIRFAWIKTADITNGIYTIIATEDIPDLGFQIKNISDSSDVSSGQLFSIDGAYEPVYGIDIKEGQYLATFYSKDVFSTFDDFVNYINTKLIILEGDHTDKSISYFEGLKSVGQGDKIEVLSYKKDSNLFDNYSYILNTAINSTTGEISLNNPDWKMSQPIKLKSNTQYTFSKKDLDGHRTYIFLYNSNKLEPSSYCNSFVLLYDNNLSEQFTTFDGPQYGVIVTPLKYDCKVSLVEGSSNEYTDNYNTDKKQISTTLRSLPNGVKDTIEKRGNKYVKVQRCGEITLNGNENWTVFSGELYRLSINTGIKGTDTYSDPSTFLCDKLISRTIQTQWIDRSCNSVSFTTTLCEICSINYLNNLADFKTWLKSNPITVVYELENPQIIELPNFNPQTFEGDTTLLINTGVIQAECEFEVTNSKGSEIEVLKDKVSSLDDYESGYEYSNDITYLNGTWKPTWAEDPYVVRIGKICILHCAIGNDAPQRAMSILKLPSFAKPKSYHRCSGRGKINNATEELTLIDYDIDADGIVSLWCTSDTTKINQMYIHYVWEVE